ncbi:MAG TPA: DUF5694 domain-containing protein [Thermoanaerobaculia bacterium]|nr:DUF5694 domain-containing protein [Thermoanaerobaculia bacterium]
MEAQEKISVRHAGWRAAALALLLVLALPASAWTQQPAVRPARAQVLVLGTYHFANPNRDYVKTNVDDHLSEKRQAQIQTVADLLAKFKPTKIALEVTAGDERLQRRYEAYLAGEYTLRANESDQIGLRLAKMLGHPRVYAVDHSMDMDFGAAVAAAQESGDRKFLERFQQTIGMIEDLQKRQATMSVREILAEMNGPKQLAIGRDLYLQIARVRSGDKYVGADQAAAWYQRNFRIFANLMQVIDAPDDRVLVIFGAGHSPLLRELVQSDPDLELVEAVDYLGKK